MPQKLLPSCHLQTEAVLFLCFQYLWFHFSFHCVSFYFVLCPLGVARISSAVLNKKGGGEHPGLGLVLGESIQHLTIDCRFGSGALQVTFTKLRSFPLVPNLLRALIMTESGFSKMISLHSLLGSCAFLLWLVDRADYID